jgi:hypothetical protein
LFVQVVFLERLWADKLEASVDSVSLTPWHEVRCSTFPPATLPLHLTHCLPPPLVSFTTQAIGSLWDGFSQEQRGFAVAVYAIALNLSAKDPVTYCVHCMRDKGCLDRAAHLIRRCFSRLSEAPIPSFVTYKARDFLNMDTSQFCDGGMLTERESFLKTLYVAPRSISCDV